MKIKIMECKKCFYKWWTRIHNPKRCPKCQRWIQYNEVKNGKP